jgi:hypothetical protein
LLLIFFLVVTSWSLCALCYFKLLPHQVALHHTALCIASLCYLIIALCIASLCYLIIALCIASLPHHVTLLPCLVALPHYLIAPPHWSVHGCATIAHCFIGSLHYLATSKYLLTRPHLLFFCFFTLNLVASLPHCLVLVGISLLPLFCFVGKNLELGKANFLATTKEGEYFLFISFVCLFLLNCFFS